MLISKNPTTMKYDFDVKLSQVHAMRSMSSILQSKGEALKRKLFLKRESYESGRIAKSNDKHTSNSNLHVEEKKYDNTQVQSLERGTFVDKSKDEENFNFVNGCIKEGQNLIMPQKFVSVFDSSIFGNKNKSFEQSVWYPRKVLMEEQRSTSHQSFLKCSVVFLSQCIRKYLNYCVRGEKCSEKEFYPHEDSDHNENDSDVQESGTSPMSSIMKRRLQLENDQTRADNQRKKYCNQMINGKDSPNDEDFRAIAVPYRSVAKFIPNNNLIYSCNPNYKRFTSFTLKIKVHRLEFQSHPIMSKDETVYSTTSKEFAHYMEVIGMRTCSYYFSSIKALSRDIQTEISQIGHEGYLPGNAQKLLNNVHRTLSALCSEVSKINNMKGGLLQKVKAMKYARSDPFCSDDKCYYDFEFVETTANRDKEGYDEQLTVPLDAYEVLSHLQEVVDSLVQKLRYTSYNEQPDCQIHYAENGIIPGNKTCCIISSCIKFLFEISTNKLSYLKIERHSSKERQVLSSLPKEEEGRRQILSAYTYAVELQIDGHSVSQTKRLKFKDSFEFCIEFNETFNCSLNNFPSQICARIIQMKKQPMGAKCIISSNVLKIPMISKIIPLNQPALEEYCFSCTNSEGEYKGSISASLSWELVPNICEKEIELFLSNTMTMKKYKHLSSTIHDSSKEKGSIDMDFAEYSTRELSLAFRLPNTNLTYFNYFHVQESTRNKLIKLRDQGLRPYTAVPYNVDKEDEPPMGTQLSKSYHFEHLQGRRNVKKENLNNLIALLLSTREEIKVCNCSKNMFTEDIVQETKYGLKNLFLNWPTAIIPPRKRSLHPSRGLSSKHNTNKSRRFTRHLIVTIFDAENMPSIEPLKEKNIYDDDTCQRRYRHGASFVQIMYKGLKRNTRICRGDAPVWKQTIEIPISDISPLSLRLSSEVIELKLFYEHFTDINSNGGYYEDEETVVKDNLFLGGASIPLNALITEQNAICKIPLTLPFINFGVGSEDILKESPPMKVSDSKYSDVECPTDMMRATIEKNGLGRRSYISLNIGLSLYPAMVVSPALYDDMLSHFSEERCNEDKQFFADFQRWKVISTSKRFSQITRNPLHITAMDCNGKEWFISRFVRSQNPPTSFNTLDACAHYVSLIPSFDRWYKNEDIDIWCSNQQCLNVLGASSRERAALLAGYFLFLGTKFPLKYKARIFIAYGFSESQGQTIHVLRISSETVHYSLWDPSTGTEYDIEDEDCPVRNLTYLINGENIYANIQNTTEPKHLNYDVSNKSLWHPFYSLCNSDITIQSVQDKTLIYREADEELADEIQDEILETLRRSIRRSRRNHTSFRNDEKTQTELLTLIQHLEETKMGKKVPNSSKLYKSVHEIAHGRKTNGGAMHFKYTHVEKITSDVINTEIHRIKHPDVEFALAVKIYPYCCNAFSVWVCFLAFVP